MWNRPESSVLIDTSQLVVGLFVDIDLPWSEHPFLYSKFRITSPDQVETIRNLGLTQVRYFPNRSTAEPAQRIEAPASPPVEPEATPTARSEHPAFDAEKKARLQKQKDNARRAERGWDNAARQTRDALLSLSRSPKQAGRQLLDLSRETADKVTTGGSILLHLLGDKQGEGPHFHALNVMTLSMVLGKALDLSEKELTSVALGALAHDVGKADIPAHLLKAKTRAKHEEEFYRDHVRFGVELATASGAFDPDALAIVAEHHEFLDGSGFPQGRKRFGKLGQIVGLVNRYDRLCGPESPDVSPLMPAEALSVLFARESTRFDPKILGTLVKTLGVYPPGSIVVLNDGSLGLVVSPGRASMRPEILIYDADVPKDSAIIIDLSETPELKIEEHVRPASLPLDVLAWLNPRQRLSYFFAADSATD